MGQKVNPISLRLEQTNRHFDSCWFNDYNYTNVLNRDLKIQSYINLILKQIKYSSARFFIQNLPNKIKINVFFLNPKNLRKSTSRAFQLKDFSINSQRKSKIGEKNRKIGITKFGSGAFAPGYRSSPVGITNGSKVTNIICNPGLELGKKNCFLKNYKKQKMCKTQLVNYLLINSTNTVSLIPLSSSKKLNLKINNDNYGKNKINLFLRYLLLKNFSLKCSKPPLWTQQGPLPKHLTTCILKSGGDLPPSILQGYMPWRAGFSGEEGWVDNTRLSTHLGPTNRGEGPMDLRALEKKQTQYGATNFISNPLPFLFSNLVNFKLLDNANKLILTTHFLKTKIYDHEKSLQDNVLKNNLQFSSISKKSYWKNQEKKVPTFNKYSLPEKTQSTLENSLSILDPSFIKLTTNPRAEQASESSLFPCYLEKKNVNLLYLLYSQKINSNLLSLNLINNNSEKKDYIFLSLINDQALKKTHNNYNKVFKNTNNLTIHNYSGLSVGGKNKDESEQAVLNKVKYEGTKKQVPSLYPYSYFTNKVTLSPAARPSQILENFTERKSNLHLENYKNNKKKVLLLHNSPYKNHLESQLSNVLFSNVVVSFFRFSNEKQSAIFLAEEIIFYLEKRVPFFKIKNQILREISKNSFLKGLRITCSGRVGGRSKKAQRSKVQVIKYGQTSLHVFSSKIDFASKYAYTAFGLLGIKVWICYN